MASLPSLIEHAIPEGRQNLENSYANLERVAAYCEANYLQSSDKRAALENTKHYAVQSLASVAYQINTLGSNLLRMLDLQTENIMDMESQVNNIAQIVDIHKEKVERREIGVLTANKTAARQHKITAPPQQEKPQKYVRRPIDYSILDDLGHGVKLQPPQNPRLLNRTGSTISACSSGSGGGNSSIAPPSLGMGNAVSSEYMTGMPRLGSISKGSMGKEYRSPVTIAPPTAPIFQGAESVYQRYPGMVQTNQAYAPTGVSSARPGSYSAVNIGHHGTHIDPYSGNLLTTIPSQQQPIVGRVAPLPQQQNQHQHAMDGYRYADDDFFAPPPAPDDIYQEQHSPLPPPPPEFSNNYGRTSYMDSQRLSAQGNVPDWVPPNYVEKVIAIYDYQAAKPDELSFQENAVIYVLKKNEDGWYEGVLDGVTGLFPGNYVELCM